MQNTIEEFYVIKTEAYTLSTEQLHRRKLFHGLAILRATSLVLTKKQNRMNCVRNRFRN